MYALFNYFDDFCFVIHQKHFIFFHVAPHLLSVAAEIEGIWSLVGLIFLSLHSIYNVLKLRSTTIFCFQYSSHTQPPLIRHPCLNSGLFEHRVQTLLKSSRISSTSKFQTYRICSRSHRKTNHPHIQMISELPGNSYCSLLFYCPYYTKVITIKIPKYLAGCFLPLPNWGVSFYFGNLLQPACFLLLPYWGIIPH